MRLFEQKLQEYYKKNNLQEGITPIKKPDPQDEAEEKKLENLDDNLRKETIKGTKAELDATKKQNQQRQRNQNGSAL
jgi:hypothetical protein